MKILWQIYMRTAAILEWIQHFILLVLEEGGFFCLFVFLIIFSLFKRNNWLFNILVFMLATCMQNRLNLLFSFSPCNPFHFLVPFLLIPTFFHILSILIFHSASFNPLSRLFHSIIYYCSYSVSPFHYISPRLPFLPCFNMFLGQKCNIWCI